MSSENRITFRVIFFIIIAYTIFVYPWWVSLLLYLVALLNFDNYYEVFVLAPIIQFIYFTDQSHYVNPVVISIILYIIVNLFVKNYLRAYV